MMCTYLSNSEKENYSKVSDPELNQLFQRVRKDLSGKRIYIHEYTTTIKRWFNHPIIKKSYEVYWDAHESAYPEVQIMNFYPDNEYQSTLNSVVSKPVVMNYLYGILSGLNDK